MTADPESDQTTEQIIAVSTRLFAQLGFDGASMRLIGDATGLDAATVTAHVGSKTDLYRTVVGRAFEAERSAVAGMVGAFTPTWTSMSRLLDAYLDFYAGSPQIVELWLHRRMGDAADISGLEDVYVRPPFLQIAEALRTEAAVDVDVDYAIWTIVWLVSGFLSTGIMHSTPPDHPHGTHMHRTPEDLEDFRGYLHEIMRRILPLPD
ncbi:TetR/AcrR family transcriptional regulator [Actinomadura sp. 9N407]|uniref:TetR/AcrR family transcriptional regulator n=1 Tax=Actinomadura sp. 9N407 TaxID=3375154 RepID=UPI003788EBD8